MRKGDRVRIHGAAGEVFGKVEELTVPALLPALPGAPDPRQVAEILGEADVRELAFLSYDYGDTPVMFVALRTPAGWRDLRGQALDITPAAPEP